MYLAVHEVVVAKIYTRLEKRSIYIYIYIYFIMIPFCSRNIHETTSSSCWEFKWFWYAELLTVGILWLLKFLTSYGVQFDVSHVFVLIKLVEPRKRFRKWELTLKRTFVLKMSDFLDVLSKSACFTKQMSPKMTGVKIWVSLLQFVLLGTPLFELC